MNEKIKDLVAQLLFALEWEIEMGEDPNIEERKRILFEKWILFKTFGNKTPYKNLLAKYLEKAEKFLKNNDCNL